ncbi:MAG: hypothetical protein H6737_21770 [Alphaproteobacteria bacterium]|nr:hypothetical protein [Alphaproteobacteria bacterium]
MIWMSLALAQSPAELATAIPGAERQLASCEARGCPRHVAARAAWLIALDTYLSTGVADGELAATVAELDADLFASFPDVLREAATEPLAWSTQVGGTGDPPAPVRPTPPDVGPEGDDEDDGRDPWRLATSLTIEVLGPDGAPLSGAFVRFLDEQESHRAHSMTGRWTGSARYLPDGSEVFMLKGDTLPIEVFAPGYGYVREDVEITRRRRQLHTVTLQPWSFVVPDGSHPAGEATLASYTKWVAAEAELVAEPTREREQAVLDTRRETAPHARDWYDNDGGEDAHIVCLMTATPRYCD